MKRFDRLLIAFQRLTLAPIIAGSVGLISAFLSYFEVEYGGCLMFGLAAFSFAEEANYVPLIITFLLLGLNIFLSLEAAKGKLRFYLASLIFALLDFVFCFIPFMANVESLIRIIFRALLLLVLFAGLLVYLLAKKALKEEKRG